MLVVAKDYLCTSLKLEHVCMQNNNFFGITHLAKAKTFINYHNVTLPRYFKDSHSKCSSNPTLSHTFSFFFSAIIGLLYPYLDHTLGESHYYKREWSGVMRCVAVFVGINHASAKIDFANNMQLSLSLAAMSIGLWWLFDRSRSGFGLGVGIAVVATFVTQLLVYNGVYRSVEVDVTGVTPPVT